MKNNKKKVVFAGILVLVIALFFVGKMGLEEYREREFQGEVQDNRQEALSYCSNNPGASELNGDTVYCDSNNNMWTITLDYRMSEDKLKADYFIDREVTNFVWARNYGETLSEWQEKSDIVARYGTDDCNEIPRDEMERFNACNACATLNYAGFSSGWRLPYQESKQGRYCAPGEQLWDFGAEICGWDPEQCDSPHELCLDIKEWDKYAGAGTYWSANQSGPFDAWGVNFLNGRIIEESLGTEPSKMNLRFVRCFLGEF